MVNFPTSLDSLANPGPGTYEDDVGFVHSDQHANANDILEALEGKLGIGSSVAAANQVLRGTGTGVSGWGNIDTAYILNNAISQFGTATPTAAQTTTSTTIVDMTSGSVAITLTTGACVMLMAAGSVSNSSAGAFVAVSVDLDGGSLGEFSVCTSATAGAFVPFGFSLALAIAAGAHTFKLRWRVSAGTGTLNSGRLNVIELKK
jgi:hypothetical protein